MQLRRKRLFVGLISVHASPAARAAAPAERAFVVRSADEAWSQEVRLLPEAGGQLRAASAALQPGLTVGLREAAPGAGEGIGDPGAWGTLIDQTTIPLPEPPADMRVLVVTLGEGAITPDGHLVAPQVILTYALG